MMNIDKYLSFMNVCQLKSNSFDELGQSGLVRAIEIVRE